MYIIFFGGVKFQFQIQIHLHKWYSTVDASIVTLVFKAMINKPMVTPSDKLR